MKKLLWWRNFLENMEIKKKLSKKKVLFKSMETRHLLIFNDSITLKETNE